MSKIIKLFSLALLLVMFCFECAFAATYPCEGKIAKNAVNVRKKANQGSDQVGKLKQNEIVTVVGEETNGNTIWYKVEFGKGKTGYVRGDLIELRENSVKKSTQDKNVSAAKQTEKVSSNTISQSKTVHVTKSVFEKSNPSYDLTYSYDTTPFAGLFYDHTVYAPWSRELEFDGTDVARLTVSFMNKRDKYSEVPKDVKNAIIEFIHAYLKAAGYSNVELPSEIESVWECLLHAYKFDSIVINGYEFMFSRQSGRYDISIGILHRSEFLDEFCVSVEKAREKPTPTSTPMPTPTPEPIRVSEDGWYMSSDGMVEAQIVSFEEIGYPEYELKIEYRIDGERKSDIFAGRYTLTAFLSEYLSNNPSSKNRKVPIVATGSIDRFVQIRNTLYSLEFTIVLGKDTKKTLNIDVDLSALFPDEFMNYDAINVATCLRANKKALNVDTCSIRNIKMVDSAKYKDITYYTYEITAMNALGGNTTNQMMAVYNTASGRYTLFTYDSYYAIEPAIVVNGINTPNYDEASKEYEKLLNQTVELPAESLIMILQDQNAKLNWN